MKKTLFLAAIAALAFTACDDDEKDPIVGPVVTPKPFYAYVLGEGNWGGNDAALTGIREDLDTAVSDLYYTANGKALGDLANDIIYLDNYLYVAVSSSEYVAKLDLEGKEVARFSTADHQLVTQPRSLVAHDGFIYASTYGGHVARLDTASLSLQGIFPVGSYSEEMAMIGDYIAVCNSGYGAENTVSIIDTKTLAKPKLIELPAYNPQNIIAQGGRFYVNTTEYDEFWNASNTIVEINPADWSVKTVSDKGFYMAALSNGNVLIVESSTDWTTYQTVNHFFEYNPKSGSIADYKLSEKALGTLTNASVYGLDVDPQNGNLYVLCTNTDSSSMAVGSSLFILNGGDIIHEIADTGCPYASSIAFVTE